MTIRVNPDGGMGVLILWIYTVLPGGVCPMYRESIKGSPLSGGRVLKGRKERQEGGLALSHKRGLMG